MPMYKLKPMEERLAYLFRQFSHGNNGDSSLELMETDLAFHPNSNRECLCAEPHSAQMR